MAKIFWGKKEKKIPQVTLSPITIKTVLFWITQGIKHQYNSKLVIGNPLLKTGRHRHKLGRQSVSGLIKVSLFGKTRSCSILSCFY